MSRRGSFRPGKEVPEEHKVEEKDQIQIFEKNSAKIDLSNLQSTYSRLKAEGGLAMSRADTGAQSPGNQ